MLWVRHVFLVQMFCSFLPVSNRLWISGGNILPLPVWRLALLLNRLNKTWKVSKVPKQSQKTYCSKHCVLTFKEQLQQPLLKCKEKVKEGMEDCWFFSSTAITCIIHSEIITDVYMVSKMTGTRSWKIM